MSVAEELCSILKWCSILGLLPWYDSKMRCFVSKKSYTFVVHCAIGVIYLLLFWGIVKFNYNIPRKIFFVSLIVFSTTLQNIKLSIWNVDDLNHLFYELDQLDLKLAQLCGLNVSPQKHTTTMCVIVNILTALVYVGSIFTSNIEGYLNVMLKLSVIFDFLFSIQLTLQLFILHVICKRSKYVIRVVLSDNHNKTEATLGILQRHISRIVDTYNELFGWNTFLHIIVTFVGILYIIYNYIYRQGTGQSIEMLIPYFTALCLQLLHILVLTMQGQDINKHSDTIISSCCDMLVNSKENHNYIRTMGLLQQVSVKQARISAAGFFDINTSMVFLLFNLLVTYIIALVQLMPN